MKLLKKENVGNKTILTILGFIRVKFNKKSLFTKKSFYESHSQLGEDVMLRAFLDAFLAENPDYRGFYVDIGAHHPLRYSNTALFYKAGWRGINIDPTPSAIEAFKKYRPDDINILSGVAKESSELDFYMFEDHAINTFSKDFADNFINDASRDWKFLGTQKIMVQPLSKILDAHLPKNKRIDFFNIDTEGLDIEILESNNWEKYSPNYILIEIHGCSKISEIQNCNVTKILNQKGYEYVGQTLCTSLFKKI